MSSSRRSDLLTDQDVEGFHREGYLVVRGLFSNDEIGSLIENFMHMNTKGSNAVHVDDAKKEEDSHKAYPRLMHPHRVNDLAMRYLLDPRILAILNDLLGEEAIAAQSMVYFKPPGAKGQALHQDNFYLNVHPGTCIAAWTALDDTDEENGGLFVVPKSQEFKILCPHLANPELSFTKEEVDVPEGLTPVAAKLAAGDVLFFNGNLIHGSYPNHTTNRFRRSFICHYVAESAKKISMHYFPLYAKDGTVVELEVNSDGGPCGAEFD